jgi:hypothetical protein
MLSERMTTCAVLKPIDRMRHRAGNLYGAITIMLHQVIGHALRRFRAHAGQAAQGLSQHLEAGRCFHVAVSASIRTAA